MSHVSMFVNRVLNVQCRKLLKGSKSQHNFLRSIFESSILSKKIAFTLSDIGEGIREVVVKEWFVNIGDKVSQFDNICEVQSDKASVTITSRYDGVITKLHYKVDEIALVGQPLIDLETDEIDDVKGSGPPSEAKEKNPPAENVTAISESSSGSETPDNSTVLCIPSVRRIAKENKIDLANIEGTGKGGRILKEDILKYLNATPPEVLAQPATSPANKPPSSINESIKIEPMKGFTKAMFDIMTEGLKIPTFVYSDEIKVTKLAKLRTELRNLPDLNVKITFLPFFIKALSNALRHYPVLNSSIDETNKNIVYWKNHNFGVAMATSNGLAVPVIKNVESLTVLEIAGELNRLMKNGKSGSFSPDDLTGATFSVSNIGIIGGTYTKPIVIPPQVCIVAIGKTQTLPRYDEEGNLTKEEIINVSAGADHRIIDGATMANCINHFKKQIENPNLLFLNL